MKKFATAVAVTMLGAAFAFAAPHGGGKGWGGHGKHGAFGEKLAPSREAFRTGGLAAGVRLFTDVVSGRGALDGRSQSIRDMMMANAVAHQADAMTARPRPVFTCDMARKITAPTLISNGDRSPGFFHVVTDQLARCIPTNERATFHASHTVPLEDRRSYDRTIVAWLQRH